MSFEEETAIKFNVSEILHSLKNIDTSAEKIENISQLIQKHYANGETIAGFWIDEIRRVAPTDRMPFLYIANDVIQKTRDTEASFLPFFSTYIEEAVSLVCNHPEDREKVIHLLQVWDDRNIFPIQKLRRLRIVSGVEKEISIHLPSMNEEKELQQTSFSPSELHFSAFPIIDTWKQIDNNDALEHNLRQKLRELDCDSLLIEGRFSTPEKVIEEGNVNQIRQRIEECITISKRLKKCMGKKERLLEKMRLEAVSRIRKEVPANDKVEMLLQQCDEIDISIHDLQEVRSQYPDVWEDEKLACQKRKESERNARKANENSKSTLDLAASTSPRFARSDKDMVQQEATTKDDTRQLVWHPVLKELVRVPSAADEEDWRDR